jgi:hypothetical protein
LDADEDDGTANRLAKLLYNVQVSKVEGLEAGYQWVGLRNLAELVSIGDPAAVFTLNQCDPDLSGRGQVMLLAIRNLQQAVAQSVGATAVRADPG